MNRVVVNILGAVVAVAAIIAGLWLWGQSVELPRRWGEWSRPDVAQWATRCAAVGLVALGQLLVLALVAGRGAGRGDLFGNVLKLSAVLILGLSVVSAIALALAGR